MVTHLDARSILETRTVDALDRVTNVDFPDNTHDIAYSYDDAGVPFSLGRLTSIARDGLSVDYGYDRFGHVTQDGALTFGYDKNGNRTSIGYPGSSSLESSMNRVRPQPTVSNEDGRSVSERSEFAEPARSRHDRRPKSIAGAGITAIYSFDFADREDSVTVQQSGQSDV